MHFGVVFFRRVPTILVLQRTIKRKTAMLCFLCFFWGGGGKYTHSKGDSSKPAELSKESKHVPTYKDDTQMTRLYDVVICLPLKPASQPHCPNGRPSNSFPPPVPFQRIVTFGTPETPPKRVHLGKEQEAKREGEGSLDT